MLSEKFLNIFPRNLPPLPGRHILQRGPSAPEAADEISGHQDVFGEAAPAAQQRPGGLAGAEVQRPGRPGHGLCWHPVAPRQEGGATKLISAFNPLFGSPSASRGRICLFREKFSYRKHTVRLSKEL